MQLAEFVYCLLLTITVTATCARGEEERQKRDLSMGKPRRLLKRDAAILIDNFPIESSYVHKPKVIYRKVSRQRYGPPKSRYGPPRTGPPRSKHASSIPKLRKPSKKNRKQITAKYGPTSHKKRVPKPRYGPTKRPSNQEYGPPKKVPSHYYSPEPAGFAEPPADYDTHHPPKNNNNYAEPPVDSYGAPLKLPVLDNYPPNSYTEPSSHFDNQDYNNFGQEFNSWQAYQREQNMDNSYAYSKKRPLFVKPDDMTDHQRGQDDEEFHLATYSDVFTYNQNFKEPPYLSSRKKRPHFLSDSKKIYKQWKNPKIRSHDAPDDEILVGGQYAEPPPRYVAKFQPSAPMADGDEDFGPPQRFLDSEFGASATISPYVNYKHSNMAFSPQNLNDAFSIVD